MTMKHDTQDLCVDLMVTWEADNNAHCFFALFSDGLIAHYFNSFMISKHGAYRDTEVKVHHISTSV